MITILPQYAPYYIKQKKFKIIELIKCYYFFLSLKLKQMQVQQF